MYGFVEVTETPTNSLMSIQTTFDGNNLDELLTDSTGSFKTLTVSGRGNQHNRFNTITIGGVDGVRETSKKLDPTDITVKFKLKDETNEGFIERVNRLKSLLYHQQKLLRFTDEDCFYYATVQAIEFEEEESNDLIGHIHFFCSDPYKYGSEINASIGTINNNTPYEWIPSFEVTFTGTVNHLQILHRQTNKRLRVIYNFISGDTLLLDSITRKVAINGVTRMQTLTPSSEWFNLIEGANSFTISSRASVRIKYRKRWL